MKLSTLTRNSIFLGLPSHRRGVVEHEKYPLPGSTKSFEKIFWTYSIRINKISVYSYVYSYSLYRVFNSYLRNYRQVFKILSISIGRLLNEITAPFTMICWNLCRCLMFPFDMLPGKSRQSAECISNVRLDIQYSDDLGNILIDTIFFNKLP